MRNAVFWWSLYNKISCTLFLIKVYKQSRVHFIYIFKFPWCKIIIIEISLASLFLSTLKRILHRLTNRLALKDSMLRYWKCHKEQCFPRLINFTNVRANIRYLNGKNSSKHNSTVKIFLIRISATEKISKASLFDMISDHLVLFMTKLWFNR